MVKKLLSVFLLLCSFSALAQLPAVNSAGTTWTTVREKLIADRTYYVRTDGNDSNTCLANTAGGACLTIQAAVNKVWGSIDLGGYAVTIQVGDGTYTDPVFILGRPVGNGTGTAVTIQGNTANHSSVYLNVAATNTIYISNGAFLNLKWMKLNSGGGSCIYAIDYVSLYFSGLVFNTAVTAHLSAHGSTMIQTEADYDIVGGAGMHYLSQLNSMIRVQGAPAVTVTLTGTPAFSSAFAQAYMNSTVYLQAETFTGSATGPRYLITGSSAVQTNSVTLPGSSAGTVTADSYYN